MDLEALSVEELVVSIPFSSGQRMRREVVAVEFQGAPPVSIPFSSGQRMRHPRRIPAGPRRYPVSIPFSSGQRMRQRLVPHALSEPAPRFNPLFIGSKDATWRPDGSRCASSLVSIPFSSGQRMRPPSYRVVGGGGDPRFNPLFIGSKDATAGRSHGLKKVLVCFNPLFIGSKDATIITTLKICREHN